MAEREPEEAQARYDIFADACRVLDRAELPYLVGGGVAINHYGRQRPVKDIDLFVPKAQAIAVMDALTIQGGFHTRETSCTWLYKAFKEGQLVDLVVEASGEIEVDEEALARARTAEIEGYRFSLMSPEDMLLRKVHSHNEERPDLYDALSMLEAPDRLDFDWAYFLSRAERHNCAKALGFLFWAQGEFGRPVAPDFVLDRLLESVRRPGR